LKNFFLQYIRVLLRRAPSSGLSLDVDDVVNHLIRTFKEYERKKKEPFRASVQAG
jgi:hypothetical protein